MPAAGSRTKTHMFQDAAHHICPVSNALKGNVEIRVNTVLED